MMEGSQLTFKNAFKNILSKCEGSSQSTHNLENHSACDNITSEEKKTNGKVFQEQNASLGKKNPNSKQCILSLETPQFHKSSLSNSSLECQSTSVNNNQNVSSETASSKINKVAYASIEKESVNHQTNKAAIRHENLFEDISKNQSKEYLKKYDPILKNSDISMKQLSSDKDKFHSLLVEKSKTNVEPISDYLVTKEYTYSRKLFISNLNEETSEENLMYYFRQFGPIENCVILKNPKSRISRGLGYLIFQHSHMATDAYVSAPHEIDDKKVLLFRSREGEADPESFCTLFVSDFHWRITEKDILLYFRKWGNIVRSVVKNKHKNSTKFAFITYKYCDMMIEVLKASPHYIKGISLKIKISNEPPRDPKEFRKLLIENISYEISENQLIDYFGQFGKVETCCIAGGEISRKLQGHGYIIFENSFALQKIENNQPHKINDKELVLSFPNQKRNTFSSANQKQKPSFSKNKQVSCPENKASKSSNVSERNTKNSHSATLKQKPFNTQMKPEPRNMLDTLEKSKVFKPTNFNLNDFDGAGVNVFQKKS